ALNHVLKTRSRIILHNHKLNKSNGQLEIRDQNLTRQKVLIMLPFRNSAYKLINLLISLFSGKKKTTNKESTINKRKSDKQQDGSNKRQKGEFDSQKKVDKNDDDSNQEEEDEIFELNNDEPEEEDETIDKNKIVIMNYKKFKKEFYSDDKPSQKKPDDYKQMFDGNTNEYFRLGIEFTKRSCKLYAKFYSSDIIIASPLGLRTIIGAEGEKGRDYDFLSSIELLILDQTENFLMQNWEHV